MEIDINMAGRVDLPYSPEFTMGSEESHNHQIDTEPLGALEGLSKKERLSG